MTQSVREILMEYIDPDSTRFMADDLVDEMCNKIQSALLAALPEKKRIITLNLPIPPTGYDPNYEKDETDIVKGYNSAIDAMSEAVKGVLS
jgi:hypothetical protein